MSDTKIFSFPDSGGGCSAANNSVAALLPALLQNRGIDSTALMGLIGGRGNGGFFGNNGGFQDIIALIVIAAIFGNGNGGGIFGGGNNANQEGREMLMQLLNRNGVDIAALANSVHTSSDQILAGINSVSGAICNLGTQSGQNTNQIITSILQGNNALASQLCSCCCDLKQLVAQYGSENRLAICEQTHVLSNGQRDLGVALAKGFCDTGYATREQTCELKNTMQEGFAKILAGQRDAEFREMMRENQQLRDERTQYQMSAMFQEQSKNLINTIRPCPSPAYITCNPWGCNGQFSGNGYPYGGNCGCGNC